VLRTPHEGPFLGFRRIGERVTKGEIVARVQGEPLIAPCSGVVRGILRSGVVVPKGTKVVEIDPRGDPMVCFKVAERAQRIAGGVASALALLSGVRQG
jgi:xanthine dehydrogenase accessory factor